MDEFRASSVAAHARNSVQFTGAIVAHGEGVAMFERGVQWFAHDGEGRVC